MSILNNTSKLQNLLEKINALPEAGGGTDVSGGSDGAVFTNYASGNIPVYESSRALSVITMAGMFGSNANGSLE